MTEDIIEIFNAGINAVQPSQLLGEYLRVEHDAVQICGERFLKCDFQNIYVFGAGKAVAAMAFETEKILGNNIKEGIVTTKYGHSVATKKIKILESAHPVPDEVGVIAVKATLGLLQKVSPNDIVICLISGGASSLWCDVPHELSLKDVQSTFDLLIKSGASINEINIVRKHLSAIKGGQLIRYCNGARVFSLIISDVPNDDLDVIASGPTVPDSSTFQDAFEVIVKYHLHSTLPISIKSYLEKGISGKIDETPKAGDELFKNTVTKIIANNKIAQLAAEKTAKALGYETLIIPEIVIGDTSIEAKKFIALLFNYRGNKPICIIQGGESTLKVTGNGKGGRNQHFVLVALQELKKMNMLDTAIQFSILSGGTDGTDGPTNATGAVIDRKTLLNTLENNLPIEDYLINHDSYHLFEQTGNLLITGPTQTNVMDIMIGIVQ